MGDLQVIFLLHLATPLLICGCNGQKLPTNTGKVPTKTGKLPINSVSEVPTNHSAKNKGKAPSDPGKIPAQIILGKENEKQLNVVIEGLKKKQCLLEAVFYPKNSKEPIKSKEYKFFKNRRNEIYQNDPALSQLLEGLFAMGFSANEAIKKDSTKKSARQSALKQSLAYAVFFIEKRGKISLESPRGEKKKEPKAILIELIDLYNELELDIEKEIKNWQKSDQKGKKGQKGKGQKGNEKHDKKERRFLQFISRSLEIKWDANAFLGGQDNEDDVSIIQICYIIFILDDENRHRRRRHKRMPRLIAKGIVTQKNADMLLILLIVLLLFIIIFGIFNFRESRANSSVGGTMSTQNEFVEEYTIPSQNELVVATPKQIQSALAAFETIISIPYEANANADDNCCAICLDLIENETMVKPLPCNHIFHNECIKSWLKKHITCPFCRDALGEEEEEKVAQHGEEAV